jgi:hypothetical protein
MALLASRRPGKRCILVISLDAARRPDATLAQIFVHAVRVAIRVDLDDLANLGDEEFLRRWHGPSDERS